MSDKIHDTPPDPAASDRCPVCDTRANPGAALCLMCGSPLPESVRAAAAAAVAPPAAEPVAEPREVEAPDPAPAVPAAAADEPETMAASVPDEPEIPAAAAAAVAPDDADAETAREDAAPAIAAAPPPVAPDFDAPQPFIRLALPDDRPVLPAVVATVMQERQAPVTTLMALFFAVLTLLVGSYVFQVSAANPVDLALFATATPLPPTPSYTPTVTLAPTETSAPTETPAPTVTPLPSATPPPPRLHQVNSGETLFVLGYRFDVSVDSIVSLNELDNTNPVITVGQELLIPWPTPTPPLVAIALELDGQTYIVDPAGCERYQIQDNDSLVAIGARFDVDFRAIQAVNRIGETSVLRPGDTLCIPTLSFSDGDLPATPGPSPTPTATPPPAGPDLLYPTQGQVIGGDTLVLQWLAVQDLAADQWYMVELVDLDDVDAHPYRGFTQDNAFRAPAEWQPAASHHFIWRVRIVRVVGQRSDGAFEYTYGGTVSADGAFMWGER